MQAWGVACRLKLGNLLMGAAGRSLFPARVAGPERHALGRIDAGLNLKPYEITAKRRPRACAPRRKRALRSSLSPTTEGGRVRGWPVKGKSARRGPPWSDKPSPWKPWLAAGRQRTLRRLHVDGGVAPGPSVAS